MRGRGPPLPEGLEKYPQTFDVKAQRSAALQSVERRLWGHWEPLPIWNSRRKHRLWPLLCLFVCLFESERNIHLFFYLFMHSLVDSCMCPGRGLNPQPWRMVTML